MQTTKTVFFMMVRHPTSGWIRVGNAYPSRESAKEWAPFVRRAWRGLRTKVEACTLKFENGLLSDESKRVLDQKFNIDA